MPKDLEWRRGSMLLFLNVIIWFLSFEDVRCAAPSFVLPSQESSISVLIGEPTILLCSVRYNNKVNSFDVEWYKDDARVRESDEIKVYRLQGSNQGAGMLQFETTSADDSGSYRCEVAVNGNRISRELDLSVTSSTFAGLKAKQWMIVTLIIVLLLLCFVIATICLVCKSRKANTNYATYNSGDEEKMIPMNGDPESSKFHTDFNSKASNRSKSSSNTYNRHAPNESSKRSHSDGANGVAGRQSQKNSVSGAPSRKPLPILPKKQAVRTQSDNINASARGVAYTNNMSSDDVFGDGDENFYSEVDKHKNRATSDPTDSPVMSRSSGGRKSSEEYMYVTPNVFHTPEAPKSNNHNKLRRHSSDQTDSRTLEAFRNKLKAENPYASTRNSGKEKTIDKYEKQCDEAESAAEEDFYLELQDVGKGKAACQDEPQGAQRQGPVPMLKGVKNHGIFKTSQPSVRKPLRF